MDNELALRTIGYLIGYYKTHDETMINPQEIEAIDFLLEENQQLKEKLEVSKHNQKQASDSCRQHRLASKNHIRRLERREKQILRLKKQLEEKESQQKEFLEYLKNKERQFDIMGDPINSGACLGISREYKKIIGVKDE